MVGRIQRRKVSKEETCTSSVPDTSSLSAYIANLLAAFSRFVSILYIRHRQSQEETTPLLGEGTVSLQDPESGGTALTTTKDVLAAPYGTTDNADSSQKDKKKEAKVIVVPKGNKADDDGSTLTEGKSVISTIVLTNKPHVPPQNPCLWLFHLLQGLAALASFCLFIAQLLPFLFPSKTTAAANKGTILSGILKFYLALICLFFIVVEADLPVPVVRNSTLLNAFWSRGFIYSFIGLVCTTEAYSERVDDLMLHSNQRFYIGWGPVFMQVSSWLMFAIGAVYMLLGMCCLRGWRDKMKQKEKDDWKQYRQDLKAWKKQQRRED